MFGGGHNHGHGEGGHNGCKCKCGGKMPKMNPKQMEVAKKIFEQRQQMMKDYMEKKDDPEALKEMMAKAAEQQKEAMAQMKAASKDPATSLLNADLNNSKLDDLIASTNKS